MSTTEQTYIMVKPDGVQRGLVGNIVKRFETKGYKCLGLKLFSPTKELLEQHYADLATKKFFPGLIEYMLSGPVCCMVWEGMNAVKEGRKMLGATKPADSALGTIRGDFCIDVGRNLCHGSDAVESAQHEIKLWFPEGLLSWDDHSATWVYENPPTAAAAGGADAGASKAAAGVGCNGKPINEKYMTYSDNMMIGNKLVDLESLDWLQKGDEAADAIKTGKFIVVFFWGKYAKGDYKLVVHMSQLAKQNPDIAFFGIACDAERADAAKLLTKVGTAMPEQAIDNFEADVPMAFDPEKKVNSAFKRMAMLSSIGPGYSMIIDKMGSIKWVEQFTSSYFVADGQFIEQLRRVQAGEDLISNGPRPEDEDEEEEITGAVGGDEFDAFADGDGADY